MSALILREARARDLPAIVAMLADDDLGRSREDASDLERYSLAFGQIEGDNRNLIIVAELNGGIVGCLQLTFIRGLSRKGAQRGLIEGVRVARSERDKGIGETLVRHAIEQSRETGCTLVQLTSDKRRGRAHKFYERLGFVASHEGFKLELMP